MGAGVLVLGHSGSGKSTSLRNFEPDEIGIFNVAGKPLPFRKKMKTLNGARYGSIMQTLQANNKLAYSVDDANYLMAFENFAKAKHKGYDKFVDMAVSFERMLEQIAKTNDDTIVYVMMHPDFDDAGNMKPKTIGKMLDNQLTIEGMFPIVLVAYGDDTGYHFQTNDPTGIAKSPMEMFESDVIDNDLKAVDTAIRDYWGLRPLSTPAGKPEGGDSDG